MTLEELHIKITILTGQAITFKRLAGNTLILYFNGEAGDASVQSIWLDPPWRFIENGRVLVGSLDIPISYDVEEKSPEEKNKEHEEFERYCALTDSLNNSILEQTIIDPITYDITLKFSGNQIVSKFCNTAFDDEQWAFIDVPSNEWASVSPLGIYTRAYNKDD
jgi:hypothetical protein